MRYDYYLKVGDERPIIEDILDPPNGTDFLDAGGNVILLSAADSVAFRFASTDGTPLFQAAATVVDPIKRSVRYTFTAGQLASAGTFFYLWVIYWGVSSTIPQSLPGKGYGTILVEANLT